MCYKISEGIVNLIKEIETMAAITWQIIKEAPETYFVCFVSIYGIVMIGLKCV